MKNLEFTFPSSKTFLFSYKIFILNSYANTIFPSIAVFVFRLNLFKKKFKDFYSFDVKNSSFQSLNLLMMRKLKKVIKTLTIFCIFNFLLLYLHNLFDNLTNYGFVAITFFGFSFLFCYFSAHHLISINRTYECVFEKISNFITLLKLNN
jgi:hypothetical protein